jgi:hypothetical protein
VIKASTTPEAATREPSSWPHARELSALPLVVIWRHCHSNNQQALRVETLVVGCSRYDLRCGATIKQATVKAVTKRTGE